MADKEQASSKEVSEYFYNDPERGRRNLEEIEKEQHTNPAKANEIEIKKDEDEDRYQRRE